MYKKWIQMYISGHMVTRLSTVTQEILVQLGGNGTNKHPPRKNNIM